MLVTSSHSHSKGIVISRKSLFQGKVYFKEKSISRKSLFQGKVYFKEKPISKACKRHLAVYRGKPASRIKPRNLPQPSRNFSQVYFKEKSISRKSTISDHSRRGASGKVHHSSGRVSKHWQLSEIWILTGHAKTAQKQMSIPYPPFVTSFPIGPANQGHQK
jgi:hypothetical protein